MSGVGESWLGSIADRDTLMCCFAFSFSPFRCFGPGQPFLGMTRPSSAGSSQRLEGSSGASPAPSTPCLPPLPTQQLARVFCCPHRPALALAKERPGAACHGWQRRPTQLCRRVRTGRLCPPCRWPFTALTDYSSLSPERRQETAFQHPTRSAAGSEHTKREGRLVWKRPRELRETL